MQIEILNWDKYNPRKDLKYPTWFRLTNGLFTEPQFCDWTHSEICFWVYLLCLASRKQCSSVDFFPDHAEKFGNFNRETVAACLKKLAKLKCISVSGNPRTRSASVQIPATISPAHYDTVQDGTVRYGTETPAPRSATGLPRLAEVWNLNRGKLPAVIACKGSREKFAKLRWNENPSEEFWVNVISKINASPFCTGRNDRGWRADFDFLIKPDTATKVLEGKYDDKNPSQGFGPKNYAQAREDANQAALAEYKQSLRGSENESA